LVDWLIGNWDIKIPTRSIYGPSALRCGRGIWVDTQTLLQSTIQEKLVPTIFIDAAQKLLAAMAGDGVNKNRRDTIEDDPDYQEWLTTVGAAGQEIERLFYGKV